MRRRGTATVRIVVQIPLDQGRNTWKWVAHPEHSPAGDEPVYSPTDLERVLLGYGAIVSQLLRRNGPTTFRLLACGLLGGRTVGSYQWSWDSRVRRYEPNGEPWVIWDAQCDALIAELREGLEETQPVRVLTRH